MLVDEDFLSMFSFPVVKGNKAGPLKNLSNIVITETAAKKIFGTVDPIGKSIKASAGSASRLQFSTSITKSAPGIYSATIPAQASGTMVTFYVEAKDSLGATNQLPSGTLVAAVDGQRRECIIRWGDPIPVAAFASTAWPSSGAPIGIRSKTSTAAW